MDYKKVAADLLSGCEENCANCEYAGDSEFECTIAQLAATAITDLLTRAEAAESRAEKAEMERDAAITAINNAYRAGAITVNDPKFMQSSVNVAWWTRTVKEE